MKQIMKGFFFISVCLYICVQGAGGRTHHLSSNMCQPCAGASAVSRPLMRLQPRVPSGDICHHANRFTIKLAVISNNITMKLYQLVTEVFDGDTDTSERAYLNRQTRHCSLSPLSSLTSPERYQMTNIYSRLVSLHQVLKFIETHHPWNNACSVVISGTSDDLAAALCDLHQMIRVSSQTQQFESVCQKEGCYNLRRGCVPFQKHSLLALRYAQDVMNSVNQDITLLKEEWGC